MAPNLFRILLVCVAFYAFWRGRRDERRVGVILVALVTLASLRFRKNLT